MVEELKAGKIGSNLLSISSEIASCCFVAATISFNVAGISLEQTFVSRLTFVDCLLHLKEGNCKSWVCRVDIMFAHLFLSLFFSLK